MKTKQAAVDWPTVLKLMGGGAALGTGVGAASTLVQYLNNLNMRAKKKRDTSLDDDVLYLNLPAAKEASVKSADNDRGTAATFAFGGLGSLMGAYLAYNLVRSQAAKIRRQQLQGELDNAQNTYLTGLAGVKQASQFSGVSKVVGSGYLAGLLTILGSAILTNKILQRQFPSGREGRSTQPRKIVIRSQKPGMEKEIPAVGTSPDAMENLARLNLANQKSASAWGLTDLVAAVGQGRGAEIKEMVKTAGLDAAMEITKGASDEEYSRLGENLAISWLAHDPLMSEALAPYLAAQFHNDSPTFSKAAAALLANPDVDPQELDELVGLTEVVAREVRKEAFANITTKFDQAGLIKTAARSVAFNPLGEKLMVADAVTSLLDRLRDGEVSLPERLPPVRRRKPVRPPSFKVEDPEAAQFLEKNKDLIDQALSAAA